MQERVCCDWKECKPGYGPLLGCASVMRDLFETIARVSQGEYPVLIVGESGTGKELVARTIHQQGPRANHPFYPVDCGALTPTLIETELFGHVRGAFTGAVGGKTGLLEAAGSGTVFLDEIAELPVELQPRLLRVLEEKRIRKVGSVDWISINARILAATNRPLEVAVQENAFRKDLYYRLNIVTLRMLPLRERKADIALLANHFLDELSPPGKPRPTLSEEALNCLLAYDWPGNVRELKNCIERAVSLSSEPVLQCADLALPRTLVSFAGTDLPLEHPNFPLPLDELERRYILKMMAVTGGDKLLVARLLGIGRTTLYRKLKAYQALGGNAERSNGVVRAVRWQGTDQFGG